MINILIVTPKTTLSDCLKLSCQKALAATSSITATKDAIAAMDIISKTPPQIIFFELFLAGISSINFLNELILDSRLHQTLLVLISNFEFTNLNTSEYPNLKILNLETATPDTIADLISNWTCRHA